MSQEQGKTRRRKYRNKPETLAARVREKADAFNAVFAKAKEAGLEVEGAYDHATGIVLDEIRINKTL